MKFWTLEYTVVFGIAATIVSALFFRSGVAPALAEDSKPTLSKHSGLLGESLDKVEKESDFFTFFNLAQVGRKNNGSTTIVTYKPTGEEFKPLATINVTVDSKNTITGVEAVLSRSFVDDPKNGIFARDIAKSLFSETLTGVDRTALTDLIDDIQYRGGSKMNVIAAPGYGLKDPSRPPAAGYDVFVGSAPAFIQQLSATVVSLANTVENGEAVLRLATSFKPTA